MGVRVWIALAVYVGLLATLSTSLYAPFEHGDDDSWAVFLLLIALHVGIGVAIARTWVLALPVLAGIVGFFATGGEALSWLIPMYGVPIALAFTALGWLAGWGLGRHAAPVAAVVFALAAAPAAWAGVETMKRARAPHVPATVQRQLDSVSGGCEGGRGADEGGRALLRELEREPDALVTKTYTYAEQPGSERRDITVRELAEETLAYLRSTRGCWPGLRRQLEHALDS